MTPISISLRIVAACGALALVVGCTEQATPRVGAPMAISNPPPVPPGPAAIWYHVQFGNDSFAISSEARASIDAVSAYLRGNPGSVATIIGKTDSVGSQQYNMHLSHERADAVRNVLVYTENIEASRVETRWVGEGRQTAAPKAEAAGSTNRVVDIAIH